MSNDFPEYGKIVNVYKRDHETNRLLPGRYANDAVESLKHTLWVGTEKIDGTNIRIRASHPTGSRVRGRTDNAQIPPQLLKHCEEIADRIDDSDARNPIILYGEGCGPKIQKNGERYGDEQHFRLFDVKVGRFWLQREDVDSIAAELSIPSVDWWECILSPICLEALGSPLGGFLGRDYQPEGYVLRPATGLLYRDGSPIRVKMKEVDFAPLRQG